MANPRPPVLIEDWLPFDALGAESQRERGASSALPPLYFLHVWWSRKPLTMSRAAVLGSVLPQWSAGWPAELRKKFPDEETYRAWFVRLLGIRGDPVAARKLIQEAKAQGIQLQSTPYNAPRAFTVNPQPDDLRLLGDLLEVTWGTHDVAVMDVTAGGGSIPFEALRYGFTTYANELNPVASVILKATLDYPARYGVDLAKDIRKWGDVWSARVTKRLVDYFPKQPNESIFAYLWVRTVACPTTGKPVPLSPNWWLSGGDNKIAAKLIARPESDTPTFIIQRGDQIDFDPEVGTVSRGVGLSPWTGEAIDGDYIKAEAQAGRMGQMLHTVAVKRPGGLDFRMPTADDLQAIACVEAELATRIPVWEAAGLVPSGEIDEVSNYDRGHRLYGVYRWSDFFSPRQLLSMLTFLEILGELGEEIHAEMDAERAAAVETYLAVMLDKAIIYNNNSCRYNLERGIRSIFDQHNFAFVWNPAEFDASANLLPWSIDQIVDAYSELAELASPAQYAMWLDEGLLKPVERLQITQSSATSLTHLPDGSIHNITFDPPYEANVMYAELSDFFYVWLKRSAGHLYPEFFRDHLTDKDNEVVSNEARFKDMGRNKKALALQDYQRKMEAIFRECHRVLREDGVLTVMFTHKKVEAWDTLAAALINAGFAVEASWPVHTESQHSLHQAKKNAAASTILLVCRKRTPGEEPVWWDDIKGQVRRIARQKAEAFAAQGVGGVDLYISTFGPALSVISAHWPVLTGEVGEDGSPLPLRPEMALDLAREEVIALRKQGLLLGRDIDFDKVTDWVLMAWDAFKAAEFPYDEARKLAIALDVDLDGEIRDHRRLVVRKSSSVVLQEPTQRRHKGTVDAEAEGFDVWIDALHTALMVLDQDGTRACEAFLKKFGFLTDDTFKRLVQALVNAIPRTRIKGKWVRPEAELLERLRMNFFPDIEAPAEPEPIKVERQLGLFDDAAEEGAEVDEEIDEEGEE